VLDAIRPGTGARALGLVPRINRRHPLADALCWLAWPISPGVVVDLVTGQPGPPDAATPTLTQYGAAPLFPASSAGIEWTNTAGFTTSNGAGTGDFTVAALANPTDIAGGGNYGYLLEIGNYVLLATNQDYFFDESTGAFSLFCTEGYGAVSNTSVLSGTPRFAVFAGVRWIGNCNVYVNGVSFLGESISNTVDIASASAVIGGGGSAGAGPACNVWWAAAWNRALSQAEQTTWFSEGGEPLGRSGLLEWPRLPAWCRGANLTLDSIAPAESAETVRTDRPVTAETSESIAADGAAPAEFAGDATFAVTGDEWPACEALATVAVPYLPDYLDTGDGSWLDTGDGSYLDSGFGWQGGQAPIEFAVVVDADNDPPMESGALLSTDDNAAAEFAGSSGTGVETDGYPPIEIGALLLTDQFAATEQGETVARDPLPSIEGAATVPTDREAQAEVSEALRVDPSTPAESAAAQFSDRSGTAEGEYTTQFGAAASVVSELPTGTAGGGDPVTEWLSPAEAPVTPPATIVYVPRGRLRHASESLGGSARAFAPLAPGGSDNFAFDFTAETGETSIVAAIWECALRPFQSADDPLPQTHVLAQSAQSRIATEIPQLFPAWREAGTVPVVAQLSGAFAVALIGGFTPAEAGALYTLTATVATSDGRTLSANADLPIESC
jgi:hypothetical protein